jgi:hypothetical protein
MFAARHSLCLLQVLEPVLLLGLPRFAMVDIRVRVSGGGYVAQIYGEMGIVGDVHSWMGLHVGFWELCMLTLNSCVAYVVFFSSHSPVHRQGHCRFLPEVCEREREEGSEGYPAFV